MSTHIHPDPDAAVGDLQFAGIMGDGGYRTRVYSCTKCGALVVDRIAHLSWHEHRRQRFV